MKEETEKDEPLSWRGLLLFRSLYFLDGLGGAAWGRFGVIYYNIGKGLNEKQIGALQGIRPLLGFIMRPWWGFVADRLLQSRKFVFVTCKVGATACLLTLPFASSFYMIAFSVGGMALFPTVGVLDAHALDFLGEAHRGMYGSIRLWATISWGVGSVVMGVLTDHYGFVWNFGVFGSMMVTSVLFTVVCLPARSTSELAQRATKQTPEWAALRRQLFRWPILLWLLQVTLMGAAMSLVDSFLFVYLQNDLQASTAICGYTVGVTVLLEIPVFGHSKFLLSNVGHDGLFVISMLAYTTRVLGYTMLTPNTVHYILLLEVLHGITFSTAWIAAVDVAAQISPKEWSTLVQSILSAVWSCVGGGLGPLLGGMVYERYGAATMFRGAAAIVAIALLIHITLWKSGCFGHGTFLQQSKVQVASQNDEHLNEEISLVAGAVELAGLEGDQLGSDHDQLTSEDERSTPR